MKEYTERIISINLESDPIPTVSRIESTALELYENGWYFIESKTDSLLENITLFFEREITDI